MQPEWDIALDFWEKAQELERLVSPYIPEGEQERALLLRSRHAKYAKAQNDIIAGLLDVARERKSLKQARQQASDRKTRQAYDERERALKWTDAILRKLADTIAWQLLGGQLWLARRLSSDYPTPPSLLTSNVESCVAFANNFNSQTPLGFALLSDITSFISIGDILAIVPIDEEAKQHNLSIIELKEGEVNHRLMDIAQFARASQCPHLLPNVEREEGTKRAEQVKRLIKQVDRMAHTQAILNEGQGIDDRGRHIHIHDEAIALAAYEKKLVELIEESKQSNWAIADLDGCLFLGVYRGSFRDGSAFRFWMQHINAEGPITDFRDTTFTPLAVPMHMLPNLSKHAWEIMRGEVVILTCFALDKFMSLASAFGLTVEWVGTDTAGEIAKEPAIFVWNNKLMRFRLDGAESYLARGSLVRTLFDLNTPSSVIELIGSNLIKTKIAAAEFRAENSEP